MPALDEVEGIGPEHAIEFLIDGGVDLFLKVLLEQFREEVDHGLEEVLILEDVLGLAVAQQDPHVDVTDLLALLLQLMRLEDHQSLHLHLF